jgi:DNA-directed RNA polymerase subunit F
VNVLTKVQDWAHADIRDCIERIEELTGELQAKEETIQMLFDIIDRTHEEVLRIWREGK